MITIDLNCDLGEGLGNEDLLMPFLSSCNIACGGHAGDQKTMKTVVECAQKYQVKIGAHPSFPDKVNFGRQRIQMSPSALRTSLTQQIQALKSILDHKNLTMHHVKPHGALYNLAAIDVETAKVIIECVNDFGSDLKLYVPFQSEIAKIAIQQDIPIMYEAFVDRNYNDNLTLVSRSAHNALIEDADTMFMHIYKMIFEGKVKTVNGIEVTLKADTFCVHGDGKYVVENLKKLTEQLQQNNIYIS